MTLSYKFNDQNDCIFEIIFFQSLSFYLTSLWKNWKVLKKILYLSICLLGKIHLVSYSKTKLNKIYKYERILKKESVCHTLKKVRIKLQIGKKIQKKFV